MKRLAYWAIAYLTLWPVTALLAWAIRGGKP